MMKNIPVAVNLEAVLNTGEEAGVEWWVVVDRTEVHK
ncbi:hypothetical protein QF028_004605 [Neobacillus sp. B4I6]|jgi:hypothetical protein